MKNLSLLSSALFLASICFAQVPQGISYQAAAYDAEGTPIVNGNVGVRISILDNSASGVVVYSETHTKTTNVQGLFTLTIGQGKAVTGNFSEIKWGVNSKHVKVELDADGGTDYTFLGTSQLMSVPYALYAGSAANAPSSKTANGAGSGTLAGGGNFLAYGANDAHAWSKETKAWTSVITKSGSSIETALGSDGNFLVINEDEAVAWNAVSGTWIPVTTGGGVIEYASSSNGNFLVVSNDEAMAWCKHTSTWTTYAPALYPINGMGSSGNFLIVTDAITAAWNGNTGEWVELPNAANIFQMNGSGGNFVVANVNEAFAWDSETGEWIKLPAFTGDIELLITADDELRYYDYLSPVRQDYDWINSLENPGMDSSFVAGYNRIINNLQKQLTDSLLQLYGDSLSSWHVGEFVSGGWTAYPPLSALQNEYEHFIYDDTTVKPSELHTGEFEWADALNISGLPVPTIVDTAGTGGLPALEIEFAEPQPGNAIMEFEKTEHDFGRMRSYEPVEYTFKFKNAGTEPLIITEARASCGCTVPNYSREPVGIGETGEIVVSFTPKAPGVNRKTVSITANTTPVRTVLSITADVLGDDTNYEQEDQVQARHKRRGKNEMK